MILDPHVNVKNPMVRKPVHMMKPPRVVTLQKSQHNSLEKRQHDLSRSGTNRSPSKSGSISVLSYGGELFGKIICLKLQHFGHVIQGNGKNNFLFSTTIMFIHTCTTDYGVSFLWHKKGRNVLLNTY